MQRSKNENISHWIDFVSCFNDPNCPILHFPHLRLLIFLNRYEELGSVDREAKTKTFLTELTSFPVSMIQIVRYCISSSAASDFLNRYEELGSVGNPIVCILVSDRGPDCAKENLGKPSYDGLKRITDKKER